MSSYNAIEEKSIFHTTPTITLEALMDEITAGTK
jgi:hypothetical protein